MTDTIVKAWQWTGRPTQTSRRWTIIVIGALCFLGLVVYSNGQADSRRASAAAAAAQFDADRASYENARDERFRCEQRVQGRDDLRGVLIGLTSRLATRAEAVDAVTAYLDEAYPALSLDDCPPTPTPPTRPED